MSSDEVSMQVWDEKHLRAATRAAGVALWSWNVDTDAITMDERAYELWEVSKNETKISFEILSKNTFRMDLQLQNQPPLQGTFTIIDHNHIHNIDQNYIAVRME